VVNENKQADQPDQAKIDVVDGVVRRAFGEYLDQVADGPAEPGIRALLEVTFFAGFQAGAGNVARAAEIFHAAADAATVAALDRNRPILADLGRDPADERPADGCFVCVRPDD